jgi:hypothetical protein
MINHPTIYTVGDSHGWHTWLGLHNVKAAFAGGPMTMFGFGRDKPILTKDIPMDAIICFCHGEIDCRCYVNSYPPWQVTIDSLVEKYLQAVDLNVVGRNHNLIWIYNVVPPIRNAGESPSFPFRGTVEERITYVKYMNKKLSESKYTFVDLYDKYSDSDGAMRSGVSDMHVHIEDPQPLIEWINEHATIYT